MPFLCPVGQLNADGIKVGSYPDQLVGQLCCTGQRAGTAQGIQHKNLLFGVFFQHHLPRGQRGVVAARKIMADGQRNAFVRHQKQLGPFFRAGAGGGAGAVIIRHGLQHGFGVQGGQVHKLALANANLEWNQCKLNPRCSVRQGTDLTRRVRCDHPFHKKSSCNAGKKLRNQPEQSGIFWRARGRRAAAGPTPRPRILFSNSIIRAAQQSVKQEKTASVKISAFSRRAIAPMCTAGYNIYICCFCPPARRGC